VSDVVVSNLSAEQRSQVLEFLLYRMDLKTRQALMGTLPIAYKALYPGVSNRTVLDFVEEMLRRQWGDE